MIAQLNAESDKQRQAIAQLNTESDKQRQAIAQLNTESDKQRQAIAQLNSESDEQRKTIGELNAELDHRNSLASSQSSASVAFEAAVHRNFMSAFDDPSRKLKFRLKKRAYKLMGRAGKLEEIGQANVIRRSLYFDRLWYLERHPWLARKRKDPAMHYLRYGANDGEEPGPFFSGRQYLERNPDVAKAGKNPLLHYELFGRGEGRVLTKETLIPSALELAPASGALEDKSETFSILFVSGKSTTTGHFYRVQYYVEAAKANGVYADWVAAEKLEDRLQEVQDFDVLVIWRASWDESLSRAVDVMRERGKIVVFDCDDLMTEPKSCQDEHHRRNSYAESNRNRRGGPLFAYSPNDACVRRLLRHHGGACLPHAPGRQADLCFA